jgi:histidinol phosphatase-like enzyme
VNARIAKLLSDRNIRISGWDICPHAPEAACACRKPLPGMIEAASAELNLDPQRSFVIGDKRADLDLAAAVGARGILVTTGYGAGDVSYAEEMGLPVCSSILEASHLIVGMLESSAIAKE